MKLGKRCMALALVGATIAFALAGCAGNASTTEGDFDKSSEIGVVTREDGSGTRGAFIELFGVEQKNEAGEKEIGSVV